MRRALVIALCATGCFSDRGVAIEVTIDDPSVASVQLFIGKKECVQDSAPDGVRCDEGIAPMGITTLLPGKLFFSDAMAGDQALSDDKVLVNGSRTVTFQLKAAAFTTLPIVIAVGFDQSLQAIATATLQPLEVPTNGARIVMTTLVKTGSQQGDDRVMVWPSPTNSCVAVKNKLSATWNFVVPSGDADCDGLPNKSSNECNANAYLATNPGGQASVPNCFGDGPTGTCLLGSLPCMDGHGPTLGTCVPQSSQQDQPPVCVPSQFCSLLPRCLGFDDLSCLQNQLAQAPHITCQVATTPEGTPCQSSAMVSLDVFYALNEKCDQPLLGGIQFTPLPTDPSHMFGNVVMGFDSPTARCNVPITWKGGMVTDQENEFGLIQLHTGDRITLLPISFHFAQGCGVPEPFHCDPAGNLSLSDPLSICAHQQ